MENNTIVNNNVVESFDVFVNNLEKTIIEVNNTPMYKHTHKTESDISGTLDCNCSGKVEALRNVLYQQYLRKHNRI